MPASNRRLDDQSMFAKCEFTTREKYFLIAGVIFVIIIIVLLALVLYFACLAQKKEKEAKAEIEKIKKENNVCVTEDCTITASYQIAAMDTSVNPCENFYQFACGNFIRKHLVPEGHSSYNVLDHYYSDIGLQNKALLENIIRSSKAKVMEKMQDIYHVCMNVSITPEKEVEALKNFAVNYFDWPLASGTQWKSKFQNLSDVLINLEKNGFINHIFPFTFFDDPQDNTIKQISFPKADLTTFQNFSQVTGEDRERIEESEKRELNLMKSLLALFGNTDEVSIQKDVDDMIRLYDAVEELKTRDAHEPAVDSYYISMEDFYQETNNKVDWLQLFNNRMKKPENYYKRTSKVFVLNIRNLKHYVHILETFPTRVILNAAGWKAILSDPIYQAGPIIDKMVEDYVQAGGQIFEEPLTIKEDTLKRMPPSTRYYYCSQILNMYYPMAMTRLYVDEYIDKSNKKSADELLDLLAKSYRRMISESEWLDEPTRTIALKKADKIARHVGYPDFIFDDNELDKEYAYMPEAKSTHFDNIMVFRVISNTLPYVTKPKRDDEWESNPTVINAHYMKGDNSVWFPAVTLRIPFFDNTRPAAVNYGMMGSVIGHEIGHAFDSSGRYYDENGKYSEWWTENTEQIFTNKSKCLIDQFNKYCPEELQGGEEEICVSGSNTIGENLADSTGNKAAFEAYQMWVKEHGQEKRLPGLEKFTPEQLFFISYASFYCENIPIANWEAIASEDVHSPGKYRVLGTLSNSQYFREAFNCPEGPMNRGKNSCTIW